MFPSFPSFLHSSFTLEINHSSGLSSVAASYSVFIKVSVASRVSDVQVPIATSFHPSLPSFTLFSVQISLYRLVLFV